jgi:dienelactone hydrolase
MEKGAPNYFRLTKGIIRWGLSPIYQRIIWIILNENYLWDMNEQEAALDAASIKYTAHQYPGTQHGFNNDTTPRFDAAAAKLAWERTLAFFDKTLRG